MDLFGINRYFPNFYFPISFSLPLPSDSQLSARDGNSWVSFAILWVCYNAEGSWERKDMEKNRFGAWLSIWDLVIKNGQRHLKNISISNCGLNESRVKSVVPATNYRPIVESVGTLRSKLNFGMVKQSPLYAPNIATNRIIRYNKKSLCPPV